MGVNIAVISTANSMNVKTSLVNVENFFCHIRVRRFLSRSLTNNQQTQKKQTYKSL